MPDVKDKAKPTGARDDAPAGDEAAQKRYRDAGQAQPQGYPADRRPTGSEAVETSGLPERHKQYGSDDN